MKIVFFEVLETLTCPPQAERKPQNVGGNEKQLKNLDHRAGIAAGWVFEFRLPITASG